MKENLQRLIADKARLLYGPCVIRRLVTGWMLAALVLYAALPEELRGLQGLEGLEQMSFPALLGVTAAVFAALCIFGQISWAGKAERWLLIIGYGLLLLLAVRSNGGENFLRGGLLILALMVVYGIFGWDASDIDYGGQREKALLSALLAAGFALGFFDFLRDWTVSRYRSFGNPTYDFGIFSQMFHYLRTTMTPMTTVERDGLLSHFAVHVSPILYTLVPFYSINPDPAMLQVLQAALMASAAIPLWLLAKRHGFSGPERVIFCLILFLYPAYGGGVSYDFHENCFLTPLILWLFYGIERRNRWLTAVAACLVLMVKEDAAVYVAVIGLWLLVRGLVRKEDRRWNGAAGGFLLAFALLWFAVTTRYLENVGEGVMTYRYRNFLYGGSESLVTAVKAVLMSPMKALYECMEAEKLPYLHLTLLPLAWLPLITRRYERLVLLIPYILLNLLSDYSYQHDIFFQYSFGSVAFMVYLAVANGGDLRIRHGEGCRLLLVTALVLGGLLFGEQVLPKQEHHVETYEKYQERFELREEALKIIPEDASVAATTYLAPHLSQRDILYDIRYCTQEHLLSAEYVAIDPGNSGCLKAYATEAQTGYEGIAELLESEGYVLIEKLDTVLEIYQKQP